MTAVISVCIKKNPSKLVNFCVAILVLKMEENKRQLWHIMPYCCKKGKNATEMQEKMCGVYGGGAVTDNVPKVVCEV